MQSSRQLDVRAIPPRRRHPEIFQIFDSLVADQGFVLVNDHDPKPLLYQFLNERPGRFDWSVLEAGPERFRVEIKRRATEGPLSVAEYLEGDHRRLDAMFPIVEEALSVGSFAEARERFAEFSCGLDRHIELEEMELFPEFEKATGMNGGGPTFVMRREHQEIRALLERVARALEAGDARSARASMEALADTLTEHNLKEEHVLYPMIDRAAVDDRARRALVQRLQAF